MNKAILKGRLVENPKVTYTNEGKAVARFRIAVNGFKTDGSDTDFLSCVAFDKKAEVIEKYFLKGSQILVDGRIKTGSYTHKETGQKVYTTDIWVNEIDFCDPKGTVNQGSPAPQQAQDGFLDIPDVVDDDGLPF